MENVAAVRANGPYKLTIEDYELLAESGAFPSGQKTELIEGKIYVMSPAYVPHAYAHGELFFRIRTKLGALDNGLTALIGGSVAMPPHSEPMPDITVQAQDDSVKGVTLKTVRLVVEVSQSTVRTDLGKKARLYAKHQVPEYWVLNLKKRQLHQHWAPEHGAYLRNREIKLGDLIISETIYGLTIETTDLV